MMICPLKMYADMCIYSITPMSGKNRSCLLRDWQRKSWIIVCFYWLQLEFFINKAKRTWLIFLSKPDVLDKQVLWWANSRVDNVPISTIALLLGASRWYLTAQSPKKLLIFNNNGLIYNVNFE